MKSLSFKNPTLACGAHLKNTFCLAKGDFLFLSKPIGDLENLERLKKFEENIEKSQKRFKIFPQIIAHDLHPEYLSTKYALDYRGKIKRLGVQHHHAHIVSCLFDNLAEYNPKTKVIGVAFDGTGFGDDGNLWGGEFLLADFKNYRRMAHLKYINLPGGEMAINEPYRVAFSLLHQIFGNNIWKLRLGWLKEKKLKILAQMLDKNINCPLSSSAGRLFDAVSAILGIYLKAKYPAQAAIELEKMAQKLKPKEICALKPYHFKINKENDILIINPKMMIKEILKDLAKRVTKPVIAYKFHLTIAQMILETCQKIRKLTGINQVALSGGVFQNQILLSRAEGLLRKHNFRVFTHQEFPSNDSSISVGQTVIANSRY